ncbi:competence type IV pilus minor pilin ComGF [Carnobacterium gallinarum]|uniref:competence type IV pilus minor pilin ComGF n=1 Tax=Carnobacterium gallinarum TaxID=2749 RepID=UPI0009FFEF21|nr:competence type IV pilus minor pilin ComGF [Carnobacterium gallinarum]
MVKETKKLDESTKYLFWWNNTKGFTLLEALVATFILILCLSLLTLCSQNYKKIKQQTFDNRQIEWHLFLNQIEHELAATICTTIEPEKVSFKYKEGTEKTGAFFYEKYNQMIRRRTTNGSGGHQPILLNVQTLNFSKKASFLVIKVTFANDESYEGKIKIQLEEEG